MRSSRGVIRQAAVRVTIHEPPKATLPVDIRFNPFAPQRGGCLQRDQKVSGSILARALKALLQPDGPRNVWTHACFCRWVE